MNGATLGWYDRLSRVYGKLSLNDRYYRAARLRAIERLGLAPGSAVMDIFCGPGVNFRPLREAMDGQGTIVGVDGSAGMLARAEAARRAVADPSFAIRLLRADLAGEEGVAAVRAAIERHRLTRFLFTLGLTCLPGWAAFFRSVWEAAPSGARFAILDVHSRRLTPGARLINWIGAADCTRPVWRELEVAAPDFALQTLRPFRWIDVGVVVASGTRP